MTSSANHSIKRKHKQEEDEKLIDDEAIEDSEEEEEEETEDDEDDMSDEVNTSDEEEEEEEEKEEVKKPVAIVRRKPYVAPVAAVRKARRDPYRKALEKVSTSESDWKQDDQFELTQNDTENLPQQGQVSPPHGRYLIVHLGESIDSAMNRVDTDPSKMVIDWKKVNRKMYSTCLWLGDKPDERLEEFNKVRDLPHTIPVDQQWKPWLHIFVLPDKRKCHGRVEYVTLDAAKTIEHYDTNNRIKGKDKVARWEFAAKGELNMRGWSLVFPSPLFEFHLKHVHETRKKSYKKVYKETFSSDDLTIQEIIDKSLNDMFKDNVMFFKDRPYLEEFLQRYFIEELIKRFPTLTDLDNIFKSRWNKMFKEACDRVRATGADKKEETYSILLKYFMDPLHTEQKQKLDQMLLNSLMYMSSKVDLVAVQHYDKLYNSVNNRRMIIDADKDLSRPRPTPPIEPDPEVKKQRTMGEFF